MTDHPIVMSGYWPAAPLTLPQDKVVLAAARPWPEARVGKCYLNVKETIRLHGGDFVYGWALTDFGPHRITPNHDQPLYRRWLNHVVWRDPQEKLWEVTPNAVVDNHAYRQFADTEFLPDPEATFEIISDEQWFPRPCRYVPTRSEGVLVADLLTKAQHSIGDSTRNEWLGRALSALQLSGFRPREWKVETIGERTGSIWLIAE